MRKLAQKSYSNERFQLPIELLFGAAAPKGSYPGQWSLLQDDFSLHLDDRKVPGIMEWHSCQNVSLAFLFSALALP